jgi:thioredoxin reductase
VTDTEFDVVIVGGGPAGLTAALNLGRARVSVAIVDGARPRNAATLRSHGFLTRDGVSPLELRKLGRAELAQYPHVRVFERTTVTGVLHRPAGLPFVVALSSRAPLAPAALGARSVLVASGLRETPPSVPNLRAFFGMSLFSWSVFDPAEVPSGRLALIGDSADLGARAALLARYCDALTVFTHGSDAVSTVEEAELTAAGVRVERGAIAGLEGDRGDIAAVVLVGGARVPVDGGFVRPAWHPPLEFLSGLDVGRDGSGRVVTDGAGRTSIAGLYAAGDAIAAEPQQPLITAADGARAAQTIVADALGLGLGLTRVATP